MRRPAWLASSLALAASIALVTGCKSSDSDPAGNASSNAGAATPPTASGSGEPKVTTRDAPVFEVNGKVLEVGPVGDDIELLSLQALPAVDSWDSITARSRDGRDFQGAKPTLLTGVRTMKLVKLPGGYEFRVMDQSDGKPYVRHKMSAVERIIIHTKDYQPSAAEIPSLTLESKSGETIIGAEIIEAIARVPEPGGKEQRDTWQLGDVIKTGGAGETLEVELSNPRGQKLVLSESELTDPGWLHVLKRNRRGEFNYRGWKLIEPATKERELRGVTRIEVR